MARNKDLHISDEKIKGWMSEMALRRNISLREMQIQLINAWEDMNKKEAKNVSQLKSKGNT